MARHQRHICSLLALILIFSLLPVTARSAELIPLSDPKDITYDSQTRKVTWSLADPGTTCNVFEVNLYTWPGKEKTVLLKAVMHGDETNIKPDSNGVYSVSLPDNLPHGEYLCEITSFPTGAKTGVYNMGKKVQSKVFAVDPTASAEQTPDSVIKVSRGWFEYLYYDTLADAFQYGHDQTNVLTYTLLKDLTGSEGRAVIEHGNIQLQLDGHSLESVTVRGAEVYIYNYSNNGGPTGTVTGKISCDSGGSLSIGGGTFSCPIVNGKNSRLTLHTGVFSGPVTNRGTLTAGSKNLMRDEFCMDSLTDESNGEVELCSGYYKFDPSPYLVSECYITVSNKDGYPYWVSPIPVAGSWGGVSWKLENETLTFSGAGPINDLDAWNASWEPFLRDSCDHVVIGSGITRLGKRILQNYGEVGGVSGTGTVSLTMGEGVTEIGEQALNNTWLTELTLPAGIETIEAKALGFSKKLVVTFTGSAPRIAADAFYGSTDVTIRYPSDQASWQTYADKTSFGASKPITWTSYDPASGKDEGKEDGKETVIPSEGGSISYTPAAPREGDIVTITVSPNEGYEGGIPAIRDVDGNSIKVTDVGGGKYTFVMPARDVVILPMEFTRLGYSVTVPTDTPNGSLVLSSDAAREGDTVTITLKPDDGYEGTPVVKDKNGNTVSVKSLGSNRFSFTMPKGNVSVSVIFTAKSTDTKSFTDVPNSAYYCDAVLWAVDQSITAGTSDDTFSPDAACTRAQIVTFLWRAAGSPKADSESPFTDVDPGSYYYDAVQWAVEKGLTAGTDANTFSPNATCTRSQAVTFLHRFENSPEAGGGALFADVKAGAYYAGAVQWAVEKGVTAGTGANTFSPDAACTRAQIVTFLFRDMAS